VDKANRDGLKREMPNSKIFVIVSWSALHIDFPNYGERLPFHAMHSQIRCFQKPSTAVK
jgi:hypothetical protein